MTLPYVSQLVIYPVKGMAGIQQESMPIGKTGPENDRRWVVVDEEGKFLSQRTHPGLALIKTSLVDDHLMLTIPGNSPIPVHPTTQGSTIEISVWKDTCLAVEQSSLASKMLSEYLKASCRLVGFAEGAMRPVSEKYAVTTSDQVGFADGFPFLIISKASLDDLNKKLAHPVPMDRFRPNIVVENVQAFAEDHWRRIRIGSVILEGVKPCSRCIVTTVDQETAERSKEPLKTLARYRNTEKGIIFGMNMIHHGPGTIQLGDKLEFLE